MAVLIIKNATYENENAPDALINYIMNKSKMSEPQVYGGQGVSVSNPANSMYTVKRIFSHTSGKQAEHFIISFTPYEIAAKHSYAIKMFAYELCTFFYYNQIQFAFHDKHIDSSSYLNNPHIHFVMNTTNIQTGTKTRIDFQNINAFTRYIKSLLQKHDITDELAVIFK